MQTDLQIISTRLNATMRTLPIKVGVVMVAFSKARFAEKAWIDAYTEPWKPRKRNGKKDQGRALMIKTGRYRRSIRVVNTTTNSVTIGSDVPYAQVHNDGFRGTVNVKAHIRHEHARKTGTGIYSVKTHKQKARKQIIGATVVGSFTRRMNMPRRRVMGKSQFLNMQINRLITAEINRVFK